MYIIGVITIDIDSFCVEQEWRVRPVNQAVKQDLLCLAEKRRKRAMAQQQAKKELATKQQNLPV